MTARSIGSVLVTFLAEFLLQQVELLVSGALARHPVHIGFQKLALHVGVRVGAARGLQVPPRLCGAASISGSPTTRSPCPSLRGLELSLHLFDFPLRQRQLIPLRRELALQHADTLTVPGSEPFSHLHSFLILDLGRETA